MGRKYLSLAHHHGSTGRSGLDGQPLERDGTQKKLGPCTTFLDVTSFVSPDTGWLPHVSGLRCASALSVANPLSGHTPSADTSSAVADRVCGRTSVCVSRWCQRLRIAGTLKRRVHGRRAIAGRSAALFVSWRDGTRGSGAPAKLVYFGQFCPFEVGIPTVVLCVVRLESAPKPVLFVAAEKEAAPV